MHYIASNRLKSNKITVNIIEINVFKENDLVSHYALFITEQN